MHTRTEPIDCAVALPQSTIERAGRLFFGQLLRPLCQFIRLLVQARLLRGQLIGGFAPVCTIPHATSTRATSCALHRMASRFQLARAAPLVVDCATTESGCVRSWDESGSVNCDPSNQGHELCGNPHMLTDFRRNDREHACSFRGLPRAGDFSASAIG